MNPSSYETVSAMIAPALFLTATASLIVSTANRMGRIIDRIRELIELGNRIAQGVAALDFPEARLAHIETLLQNLQGRNRRILVTVSELYLAFGAFVGTSLAIALDSVTGRHLEGIPTLFAVAGVLLLLLASMNLVAEIRIATRTNRLEVEFYHELCKVRREKVEPK